MLASGHSHVGSIAIQRGHRPADPLEERPMTSVSIAEPTPFSGNPIDLVEEIVVANDWAHDRASEEELVVEISGRWCDYRLYLVWQE